MRISSRISCLSCLIVTLAVATVASTCVVQAWIPNSAPPSYMYSSSRVQRNRAADNPIFSRQHSHHPNPLQMSTKDEPTKEQEEQVVQQVMAVQRQEDDDTLSKDELKIIVDLYDKATAVSEDFQDVVEEALPAFSPSLIMKLKRGSMYGVDDSVESDKDDNGSMKKFLDVAQALQKVLNKKLETARDTLSELMNAGEIKKLDALIGKAARAQQLDVAFFQVLQMNMQDAAIEMQQQQQPTEDKEDAADGEPQEANRFQILQHIYTRCQEEVEKTINPGLALLNKLLRTEVDSIRQNQLQHYLCPQPTTITAPDGKQIELNNAQNDKSLVDHQDFVEAIANAVRQIRTVEKAGGTDPGVAAGMVESCRQVAKEARIVIGEHFGKDSDQLQKYEDALMPVFRPSSPESPYIQGEESS